MLHGTRDAPLHSDHQARLLQTTTPAGLPTTQETNILATPPSPGQNLTPAAKGSLLAQQAFLEISEQNLLVNIEANLLKIAELKARGIPLPLTPYTLRGYSPGPAATALREVKLKLVSTEGRLKKKAWVTLEGPSESSTSSTPLAITASTEASTSSFPLAVTASSEASSSSSENLPLTTSGLIASSVDEAPRAEDSLPSRKGKERAYLPHKPSPLRNDLTDSSF